MLCVEDTTHRKLSTRLRAYGLREHREQLACGEYKLEVYAPVNSRPNTSLSRALISFGLVVFVISSLEGSISGSLESDASSGGVVLYALCNRTADAAN